MDARLPSADASTACGNHPTGERVRHPSKEGFTVPLSRDVSRVARRLSLRRRERPSVQRLFSMFPNGWPGTGLLLLRIASGALLVRQGVVGPHSIVIQPLAAVAGALLIAGLWTPVAGVAVVICQFLTVITAPEDLRSAILLATIGAALAMLGPGSRSLDNQFFGRKRFDVPKA
jgi:putative oxidoreductase